MTSSRPGLLVLATAAFTDVVTDQLPAGLLPSMSGGLHVSPSRVGLLVSAFAAASCVAAIPVTAALRGLPRRAVLSWALGGFALANAVTAVSSSYPLTFAARVLAGVAGGVLWSMLAGYAARMVPSERTGRAIAIVLAGITVALCAGIPAGTALASVIGWRGTFGLLAVVALLLVLLVRRLVPSFPGEAAIGRPALRRVLVSPGLRTVLVVTLLVLTGHQALYTYIALLARRAGFASPSLALLVFGVASAGGIWLAGVLADRHLRAVLLVALGVISVAMVLLGLVGHSRVALLVLAALWGAAFGAVPALLQAALIRASGPALADPATAMQTTVYNAGIAAGSLGGGLLLNGFGLGPLPWVTAALMALALTVVSAGRAFPILLDC